MGTACRLVVHACMSCTVSTPMSACFFCRVCCDPAVLRSFRGSARRSAATMMSTRPSRSVGRHCLSPARYQRARMPAGAAGPNGCLDGKVALTGRSRLTSRTQTPGVIERASTLCKSSWQMTVTARVEQHMEQGARDVCCRRNYLLCMLPRNRCMLMCALTFS